MRPSHVTREADEWRQNRKTERTTCSQLAAFYTSVTTQREASLLDLFCLARDLLDCMCVCVCACARACVRVLRACARKQAQTSGTLSTLSTLSGICLPLLAATGLACLALATLEAQAKARGSQSRHASAERQGSKNKSKDMPAARSDPGALRPGSHHVACVADAGGRGLELRPDTGALRT